MEMEFIVSLDTCAHVNDLVPLVCIFISNAIYLVAQSCSLM